MKPVIQLEATGCAIACAAALTGQRYTAMKTLARSVGVSADDARLWSDTTSLRRLLRHCGVLAAAREQPFDTWDALPDLALLAVKWHLEQGRPHWHWVVFVREHGTACVLDSARVLKHHRRTDFGRMRPKWFIAVQLARA